MVLGLNQTRQEWEERRNDSRRDDREEERGGRERERGGGRREGGQRYFESNGQSSQRWQRRGWIDVTDKSFWSERREQRDNIHLDGMIWDRSPSPPPSYLRELFPLRFPPDEGKKVGDDDDDGDDQDNKTGRKRHRSKHSSKNKKKSGSKRSKHKSSKGRKRDRSSSPSSSSSSSSLSPPPKKKRRKDDSHDRDEINSPSSPSSSSSSDESDSEGERVEANGRPQRKEEIQVIWEEKKIDPTRGPDGRGGQLGEEEEEIGPEPLLTIKSVDYGGALMPGEAEAMAKYVQENKRIPRRGEVGLTAEEIESFETLGYVMSGSRHKKMNAVRLRKEGQIYSAEEKRALATHNYAEKTKRENTIISEFRDMLSKKHLN